MIIIFVRTVLLYLTVIFAMRLMGKRQIGEFQPSELVVTLMISDLAAIPMEGTGTPVLAGIIPIFTLIVAEIFLSFLSMKSKLVRRIFSGSPSVIILNGQLNEDEMERLRMSKTDVEEELRMSGCEKIDDVEYGIVETNGKFSIILKKNKQPATEEDLKEISGGASSS